MSPALTTLLLVGLALITLHLVVAGSRLRDALTAMLGEGLYLGLFSLASLAGFAGLALAYNAAFAQGPALLWDLGAGVSHLGIIVVAIAFVLGLPGVMMPSPTGVGGQSALNGAEPARGPLRITRHPFLWSVALWAGFHLLANGDEASVLFFGTILVIAVLGTYSIDGKRARMLGAEWTRYAQTTSNIPFSAILMGRQRLVLSELLTWRQGAALLIFLGVLFAHRYLFGVSPFPGGWSPY